MSKHHTENNAADAQTQAEGQKEAEIQEQGAEKEPAPLTPEEKIAELEAQLAETRDQLLRKAADFENFRKRMNQEKQSAIDYANQSLLLDIIPVIDDFERAIQSGESSADLNAFLDGVKMIEKRLTSQLETKWGLKRFNSVGEIFDPNKHEALMMEKSPDVTEATVQEDLVKGYFLKERVIRAAKVKVLMPGEKADTGGETAQNGGD
jgi:molecular chaperone GrpE